LTIDAIDISSTAVAAKVSDGTGEVGRTFVFVDLNLSKTPTVAHGYQALTIDAIDHVLDVAGDLSDPCCDYEVG